MTEHLTYYTHKKKQFYESHQDGDGENKTQRDMLREQEAMDRLNNVNIRPSTPEHEHHCRQKENNEENKHNSTDTERKRDWR